MVIWLLNGVSSGKFRKIQHSTSLVNSAHMLLAGCMLLSGGRLLVHSQTHSFRGVSPVLHAAAKRLTGSSRTDQQQQLWDTPSEKFKKNELSHQLEAPQSSMGAGPQYSSGQQQQQHKHDLVLDKVCIIGSGNWGSAISTIVGRNCAALSHCFDPTVNMWVYEEDVPTADGSMQKLTHVINTRHENVKYLPGIPLPDNVVAVADIGMACRDANLLIFVLPHQFLPQLLPAIRAAAHPNCRGVSLIKGLGTYMRF